MEITDLSVRTVEDEYKYPFANAMEQRLRGMFRTYVVEIFTNEGLTGTICSDYLNEVSKKLITHMKFLLIGENPLNTQKIWGKMFGYKMGWRNPVAKGEVIKAMSAVDAALWDIVGKKFDVPLYQLLGGCRKEVPCYASGGHYKNLESREKEIELLKSEMSQYLDMGFKAVKMRVGRDIETDCERVKEVRALIGPDIKLMIDLNITSTYKEGVSHALKFMKALEKYDIYWFEDPLIMDDIAGLKKISERIDTAVATGEQEQTLWGFKDLIVNGCPDIVIADVTAMCGGISEWKKIAALAEAFRIPIATHKGDKASIHCVAGVPNGLMAEVFLPLEDKRWKYDLEPVMPDERGMLRVPGEAGIGIRLNEDYIKENQIEN